MQHFALRVVFGLILRQLHAHYLYAFDDVAGCADFGHIVAVVVFFSVFLIHVVEDVDGEDPLYLVMLLALGIERRVNLRAIVHDTAQEVGCPVHLHLDDEIVAVAVLAADIHGTVALVAHNRQYLGRLVLDALYPVPAIKFQHGVQKADRKVWVSAKHFLEHDVGLGVVIFHSYGVFLCLYDGKFRYLIFIDQIFFPRNCGNGCRGQRIF